MSLVHEFSGYTRPVGTLAELFSCAADIVFPAQIVAEASAADYPVLRNRTVHILPQGPSSLPPVKGQRSDKAASMEPVLAKLRSGNAFLGRGHGPVDIRKGVDLFISTAAAVKRSRPDLNIRFLLGGTWLPSGRRYELFRLTS